MSEIPKAYEPHLVEDKWYSFWLDGKFFVADPKSSKPAYSLVMPPPNVTGVLTLGHVLNNTIQDVLARKARMEGREVLWLPGTDHAGIATQTVVERALKKSGEIKHRNDLGREKFLERVWQWKEKHGGIIIQQLKKLGCSCDWTRERFTMDPEYSRCVQKVFVELYKKGLIYRGKRMVNWCPATQTALSDEEVVMKEQKGFLYYFKVEVAEAPGTFLTIATTRPETIPGDTAVAVNPKDPRYAKFIGKHVIRPLPAGLPREQKRIPIIADEHVDFEFGTGVLKVTPAHDKAEFEIGRRHQLPAIEVIDASGHMTEQAGTDLKGLDRLEARRAAVEKLKALGAFEKEEPYTHHVGFSERADVPIEPRLSEQWFLKYPSVEKARAVVATGEMKFHPERWAKVYDHWMGGLQDWCISRQLWWGHRIPVWYSEGWKKLNRVPVVVELRGNELSGSDINELRNSAFAFAQSHGIIGQDFLNLDTQQSITVHPSSLEHAFCHFGEANVKLIPALPDLLRHAIRVAVEPHPPASNGVKAVETYLAALQLGDQFFRVKFRVEVFASTRRLCDYQTFLPGKTEENEPGGDPSPEVHAPKSETSRSASGSPLTLADWVDDANSDPAFTRCQIESPGDNWEQDPDVLDTWFSSWLWPFATMGWTGDPQIDSRNETLKKFYPTTDLVTGPDIIFFWVARMIMAGYEFMGELPFRNVYFTGIIRDRQGRKMSKSLGNSPDPLDLIAKYGADALRFGVMRSAPLGQDVLFDEQNVELGRNFCNKLWNACRFRQMQGGAIQGEIEPRLLTSDDKWILLKLDAAIRQVHAALADYKFNEAAATLQRFFWSEFCDWYLEAAKAVLQGNPLAQKANTLAVMDFVLSHVLRLLHPFLPFITEELWQGMGYADDMPENQGGQTILFAPWPKPLDDDFKQFYGLTERDAKLTEAKYELVSQGRNLRRQFHIPANRKVQFIFKPLGPWPAEETNVLRVLLNAEAVKVVNDFVPPKGTPLVANGTGELYLPLEGLVDIEAEKSRLQKEKEKIAAEIARVEQKLANPNFVQKVPPQVLAEHRQRLADWQAQAARVQTALEALQS